MQLSLVNAHSFLKYHGVMSLYSKDYCVEIFTLWVFCLYLKVFEHSILYLPASCFCPLIFVLLSHFRFLFRNATQICVVLLK